MSVCVKVTNHHHFRFATNKFSNKKNESNAYEWKINLTVNKSHKVLSTNCRFLLFSLLSCPQSIKYAPPGLNRSPAVLYSFSIKWDAHRSTLRFYFMPVFRRFLCRLMLCIFKTSYLKCMQFKSLMKIESSYGTLCKLKLKEKKKGWVVLKCGESMIILKKKQGRFFHIHNSFLLLASS